MNEDDEESKISLIPRMRRRLWGVSGGRVVGSGDGFGLRLKNGTYGTDGTYEN